MTTLDHNADAIDDSGSGDESPVIGILRKQLADETKARKTAEDRANNAVAEYQAEAAKVEAAREIVSELGYPGLAADVATALEDVTTQGVVDYLKARQLPLTEPEPTSDSDESSPDGTPKPIESLTSLAQSVASAAGSAGGDTVLDRIQKARTPEEVAAIAADGGFLQ